MNVLWVLVLAVIASAPIWMFHVKAPRAKTVPAEIYRKPDRRRADAGDQREDNR